MIAYVLLRVFVILLLVAANAFFAAAEFALVSVRETRILQLIDARRAGARTVLKLHQQLQRVVNGVQLGITITSLTLGWLGEPVLARLFEAWIGSIPHATLYAHAIAVTVAFVAITSLHVILGELVPKSLALQRAERVALAVAAPMDVFLTITRPVTVGMSRVAGFVLRAFGTREIRHGSVHSPDELKLIVTAAHHSGQLSSAQEEMLLNALELDSIAARQVMIPRTRIFSLPSDLNLDEALSRVVDDQHSRVPVYDPLRGPEHIVGVLYAKDLMRWTRQRLGAATAPPAAQRLSQMKVSQVMHDVLVVPETKSLLELLSEFQQRKRHLAVVVDEFGSTAGVISVEDVLEQLVGELKDEYDIAAPQPAVTDANAPLILDGAINIRDLEAQYEMQLPQDEGYETLAGFVLSRLQKMPTGGEVFDYEGRRFVVEKMDGHRIATLRIEPLPKAQAASAPPAPVEQAGD
ncbi:MAG TPA: hemolysin family protein [Terriglobales bacterium]|jgi:putative hemolysin|nr:hemolysin family protein [Terriglobales bacterium]